MSIVNVRFEDNPHVIVGWEDVQIRKSMDDAASTFAIGIVIENNDFLPKVGDKVQISYGNELVITGYVDNARESYDANGHYIQVSGRSLTKDLVDCSVNIAEWSQTKISEIVKSICKPFGITVTIQGNDVIVPSFSTSNSETVIDALHRLADISETILTDDEKGHLVFTTAGKAGNGNNIINIPYNNESNVLAGTKSEDESNRFSEILVRSQIRGDDENFGRSTNEILGIAKDKKNVKRHRPLIIDANEPLTKSEADKLAAWQRDANTGKSLEYSYTVQGWTSSPSGLWKINTIPTVDDRVLKFKSSELFPLVISSLSFNINNSNGTTTDIVLNPISAYIPSKQVDQKREITNVKTKQARDENGTNNLNPIPQWR